MEELSKVKYWLEKGKQVGKSYQSIENEKTYWVSVGVQKWEGRYKIYVDKIEETQISSWEDYETERIVTTEHFEKIQNILDTMCSANLCELAPQKGQKVFNPAFD